jgi:hypothetical protein
MIARYSCQQTCPRPGCVRTLSTASSPHNPRARLPCASSLRHETSLIRCELPRASQRRATQSTRIPLLGWAVRTPQSLREARLLQTRPHHARNHVWRPAASGHRPSSISSLPTVVPDRAISLGTTSKPASVAVDLENYGKHAPKA